MFYPNRRSLLSLLLLVCTAGEARTIHHHRHTVHAHHHTIHQRHKPHRAIITHLPRRHIDRALPSLSDPLFRVTPYNTTRNRIDRTEHPSPIPPLGVPATQLPAVTHPPVGTPTAVPVSLWPLAVNLLFAAMAAAAAVLLIIQRRKTHQSEERNTSLNTLIRALQDDLRQKDDFIAKISHEIRTPMGAIIGLSEHLMQSNLTKAQYANADRIHNAGYLLLGIVNQILDYSRFKYGHVTLEETSFNLNDLFDNLSNIAYLKAREKKLDIIFDVDWEIPTTLIGDPLRLNQILINLVMNALKFTDKGEISILAREIERKNNRITLEFEVRDTGLGIKKEHLGKLFQPFSQTEESTARLYGGSGLGLVIVKMLVEAMGGTISVTSEYGVGTTFLFSVNLQLPVTIEKRKYRLPSRESTKKEILIIDGSRTSAQALERKLKYFLFHVDTALNWDSGRKLITSRPKPYDIIFLNLRVFGLLDAEMIITQLAKAATKIVVISYDIDDLLSHLIARLDHVELLERPFSHRKVFELLVALETGSEFQPIPASTLQEHRQKLAPLAGRTILVADDNIINQSLISTLLENTGIRLITAATGEDALTKLADNAESVNLVLMDLNMPVMDGFASTTAIRSDTRFAALPVIAITASDDKETRRRCRDAGMNGYITKPIDVAGFYNLLIEYLAAQTPSSPVATRCIEPVATPEETEVVLDREHGVNSVGSEELYCSIFDEFVDAYATSYATIKNHIDEGRYKEGEWIVHAVKGLSGSIGAKALYKTSQALNKALVERDLDTARPLLEQYGRDMAALVIQKPCGEAVLVPSETV